LTWLGPCLRDTALKLDPWPLQSWPSPFYHGLLGGGSGGRVPVGWGTFGPGPLPIGQSPIYRIEERLWGEGLCERVAGTERFGHVQLELTRARHCNQRRWVGEVPQHRDQLEAMDLGHLQVREHEVDALQRVLSEGVLAVVSEERLVAGARQDRLSDQPIGFFVVYDQNASHSSIRRKDSIAALPERTLKCFMHQGLSATPGLGLTDLP